MSNSGQKNLFNWVKRNTGGYPGVWVEDFSRSFRDGLAFCALVHTYKNSLIPFKELKADTEEDQLKNHRLAFTAAEKEWGVTQLLDAEDMLLGNEPDKLSVMTYLAEMHKNMKGEIPQGNPYEGDYLDQLTERAKQKKLEEKGGNNNNSNTSTPNLRKPVHVSKMHKDSTVDVSNIKGCGECQRTGNYPMCPGFNPEPFRKTRCSQCFHSDEEHLGFISDEEREEMEREKREKEEEHQRLIERAKRRREAKENKKKKLREQKMNEKQKERGSLLERELRRRQEEYQDKLDERKSVQRQRQKAEDERQEKFMEARRSKRVKQREYDRKASSMEEEERKQLEEELNELTRIEEETKDPYVYEEFEPIEEPPTDISQITLDDDEEIEIDSDEIELSDEELQDPSLDDVPIPVEVKPVPVKQPVKKVPLKKMAPKKNPVKKDVKKEVETSPPPKRETTTTRRDPSPKRETSSNTYTNTNTNTDNFVVEDNGERSERRFKRYQRRQKILDDNQIVESIRSLVSRIGSF